MTFRPLKGPWGYAYEAIEHIESRNCSHGRGCVHGTEPGSDEWRDIGPGGTCDLLATISIGDPGTVITEMVMDADGTVACHRYTERPASTVTPARPPILRGQLTIDGGLLPEEEQIP